MLCHTHQVYWCNIYLPFINLETAWFAKLYTGHSESSYQMQLKARLNGMFLLPRASLCWHRARGAVSHHNNGGHLQEAFLEQVWGECTCGDGARSILFLPAHFGSATCRFMYMLPTFTITRNRNAATLLQGGDKKFILSWCCRKYPIKFHFRVFIM